jgi:hypothetical protein
VHAARLGAIGTATPPRVSQREIREQHFASAHDGDRRAERLSMREGIRPRGLAMSAAETSQMRERLTELLRAASC